MYFSALLQTFWGLFYVSHLVKEGQGGREHEPVPPIRRIAERLQGRQEDAPYSEAVAQWERMASALILLNLLDWAAMFGRSEIKRSPQGIL